MSLLLDAVVQRDKKEAGRLPNLYVCPTCRGSLVAADTTLACAACEREYRIDHGIPDFVGEDVAKSSHPLFRKLWMIDKLALIYETRLWYPLVLNLTAGWGQTSMPGIVSLLKEMVGSASGLILDVACGPGTYGRRLTGPLRMVYGIDVSRGMLEQGMIYVRREKIPNIAFARAKAESLPFSDAVFDAAVCCGSLHLFPDPGLALREIRRTLKQGAPLAVITFTAGGAGFLRFQKVRESAEKRGLRVFQVAELQELLLKSGFNQAFPSNIGSLLACRATRC